MKLCSGCNLIKPWEDYNLSRTQSHGHQSRCKDCLKKRRAEMSAQLRIKAKAFYRANKKKHAAAGRKNHLRRKFGISLAQYDAMLARQYGCCAICRQPEGERRFCVDHDHTTGAVRCLLCDRCNRLIGLAGENSQLLCNAAAYASGAKTMSSAFWGIPNEDPESLSSTGVRIEIGRLEA